MVYFITGASSGIGKACAMELAKRGEQIVLFSRRLEILENLKEGLSKLGGRVICFKGDVRNIEDLRDAFKKTKEEFGFIDNLICAAGLGYLGPFLKQEPWQWEEMLKINTLGVINSVFSSLPYLNERGGKIGIICSVTGKMGALNMAVYSASKAALKGFVEGVRHELKNLNIKIVMIYPGTVETPFFEIADRKMVPRQDRYLKTLTAEEVARATIKAMDRGKRELILPFSARIFLKLYDIFPKVMEKIFYSL